MGRSALNLSSYKVNVLITFFGVFNRRNRRVGWVGYSRLKIENWLVAGRCCSIVNPRLVLALVIVVAVFVVVVAAAVVVFVVDGAIDVVVVVYVVV